jgi:putative two-component system hydrogenase maturation factor HypX/HoxX
MTFLSILFLTNAHNSMSQKAYIELSEQGHKIHVDIAHNAEHMINIFNQVKPDVVVCPFLTKKVPRDIYEKVPTLIVHPGIKGDRGPSSLDYAIRENEQEWGVTILQAAEEMDAGDIYSSINFTTERDDKNTLTKSSMYKNECIAAAVEGLNRAIQMIINKEKPEPLNYNNADVKGKLRPCLKISERKINWWDDAHTISREVRAADGRPGVQATIAGFDVFLHGAHVELHLNRQGTFVPGDLIAKRDGGVCVACGNNTAIWFTALRRKNEGEKKYFKLPALRALPSEITSDLPESIVSIEGSPEGTWKEIWTETTDGICKIHFNFHNGAMSTSQCRRLTKVIREVGANDNVNIVVLMGGHDYFSNGIHLNVIEAAENPAQESWENINAINDVVMAVMSISNKITVSAIQGNAGAGGVMMALGADYVFTQRAVVLNPHYKSMFLYGSEYWTFNLPKRVGKEKAIELTESMQPLGACEAEKIGLVDGVFGNNVKEFLNILQSKLQKLNQLSSRINFIDEKLRRCTLEYFEEATKARKAELERMRVNFSDFPYNLARRRFVYKECCGCTPSHFPSLLTSKRRISCQTP